MARSRSPTAANRHHSRRLVALAVAAVATVLFPSHSYAEVARGGPKHEGKLPPQTWTTSEDLASMRPGPNEPDAARLENDVSFRRGLGFNADEKYVRDLYAADKRGGLPGSDFSRGTLFTAEERARFEAQNRAGEAAAPVREYLAKNPDPSLAGMWLDRPNGVFVVAFTRDVSAHDALLRPLTSDPAHFRVVSARHSLDDLKALQQRIDGEWAALGASGVEVASTSVDEPNNVVTVGTMSDLAHAAAVVAQRYPGLPVRAVTDSPLKPTVNEKKCLLDAPPIKGGQCITRPNESDPTYINLCTSGFVGYRLVATSPFTWNTEYFTITAGHCGSPSGQTYWWQSEALPIGGMDITSYCNNCSADAARIKPQGISVSNQVWINCGSPPNCSSLRYSTPIWTQQAASQDFVGQAVCQAGITSTYVCGTISNKTVTTSTTAGGGWPARTLVNMRRCTCISQSGDSGGPAFYNHTAMGITHGAALTGTPYSAYSHIQNVTNVLGIGVLTSTP